MLLKTGRNFRARENPWPERFRCTQSCCDRRHHRRPLEGHIRAVPQHSHQAHGRGVARVCSVLRHPRWPALQDLLSLKIELKPHFFTPHNTTVHFTSFFTFSFIQIMLLHFYCCWPYRSSLFNPLTEMIYLASSSSFVSCHSFLKISVLFGHIKFSPRVVRVYYYHDDDDNWWTNQRWRFFPYITDVLFTESYFCVFVFCEFCYYLIYLYRDF